MAEKGIVNQSLQLKGTQYVPSMCSITCRILFVEK